MIQDGSKQEKTRENLRNDNRILDRRRLHELDRRSVGIEHVNDPFSRIRTRFEGLRSSGCFPARGGDGLENRVQIIDHKGDVDRTDVARSGAKVLPVEWSLVFEQLDLMSVAFQNRD